MGEDLHEIGIGQESFGGVFPPHEPLGDGCPVERDGVNKDAQGGDPEVCVGQFLGPEFGAEDHRDHPVEHSEDDTAVPSHSGDMDMGDGPVGEVGDGVDIFEGHHGAFEGGHPVCGEADHEEFKGGAVAYPVPCTAQGEETVDHPSPGRGDEHDREGGSQGLCPSRQCLVKEMVGACPHIEENQRPEMDDTQFIGVDGPVHGLGKVVIHQSQDGGGQEKGDGVMAIPPLDHGVLGPGIY